MKVVVQCPAKLNLFLAVGPKDQHGYHPLRTIFQAVSLFDILEVESSETDSFVANSPALPEVNTVTKALSYIKEVSSVPPLRIVLEKHIPSEAGLGGGSSDAGGLLRAIDAFLPAPLTMATKRDIAVAVGADVPFFLMGGKARAEGYGEILEPLNEVDRFHYVVWKPPFGCPTGQMFKELDSRPRQWLEFPVENRLYNDFERVAPCGCLERIDVLLSLGAVDAGLSGSGSAVFGRFESEDRAIRAKHLLPPEEFAAVCSPMARF
ncbi:MAG TPA: 4-(cytidine 5'-diphospho)-2-C-methyl-D-erythritol kinase [Fimbriimonadaceae bacterium]|nr:4-(cytidine 5'-diphospho)-2-C-methyl-D-erythritol kinase [Fimbriimonadaceae bacterium]